MSKYPKKFTENILNGCSTAIFVKDSNLNFTYINKAFTELTGLEDSQILGKNDYDFFPTAQADIFKAIDLSVLESGIERFFKKLD